MSECVISTPPDYYLLPFGDFSYEFQQLTGVLANGEGYLGLIHIDSQVEFTQTSILVDAYGAASNVYVSIYNLPGTQVAAAKIPITANGLARVSGLGPYFLMPGTYWLMVASDNSASSTNLYGSTPGTGVVTNILNANQFRWGQKGGQVVNGALPTSISPSVANGWTANAVSLPLVLLEP